MQQECARQQGIEIEIDKIGVIGAGQMGNGIAHVCALAGLRGALNDVSQERIKAGLATINGNMARQVAKDSDHRGRAPGGARAASGRPSTYDGSRRLRPRHRGGDRERGGQAQDLRRALPVPEAGRDHRHQHLLDLDHPAGRRRPTGPSASSASIS